MSQATAFPFAAAESERNKRLPLLRGQFPATAFSFVAAKIWAERRLPWPANQCLTTAFSFVVTVFEADERCPRRQSQSLTTALSFVVADFVGGGGGWAVFVAGISEPCNGISFRCWGFWGGQAVSRVAKPFFF